MRRLFIIRKDLHLTHGKMAAMVGHCAEAYWTRMLSRCALPHLNTLSLGDYNTYTAILEIDRAEMEQYINASFVKTICEAKNLNQLRKAETIAKELGLVENVDYGYINDNCYTELTPENEDGTCTVGMWFKPLDDEIAHKISKKFQLYKD